MYNNRSRAAVNQGDTRREKKAVLFSPSAPKLEVVPAPALHAVMPSPKKEKLTGKHLGAKVGSVHDVVLTTRGDSGVSAEFRIISKNGERMLEVLAIDELHPMGARVGDMVSVDLRNAHGAQYRREKSTTVAWLVGTFARCREMKSTSPPR
jgi:hypothetical protein